MNSKITSKGAKQLLYDIDGHQYDYDSLMSHLQADPTLLLKAEDIKWIMPLGFIVKKPDTGSIVDYFTLSNVEDENTLFTSSTYPFESRTISDLLGTYPVNYSSEFDDQMGDVFQKVEDTRYEQSKESEKVVVEMTIIKKSDVYVYNPKVMNAPFIFRKGSHIPLEFLTDAAVVYHGDRNSTEDTEIFELRVKAYVEEVNND